MSAINDVKLNDTLNRAWKDDKTGFGFRMLQKMGWKEDKGLGKNEEGMVDSVKVKRRGENEGLGTTKDQAGASGWTKTVSGFSAVLEMLNSSSHKDPSIKKLKKSKKRDTVQVRIKYNKMSAAKDFSIKTDAEKSAILGTKVAVKGEEGRKKEKKSKKAKRVDAEEEEEEAAATKKKRRRKSDSSDDEGESEKSAVVESSKKNKKSKKSKSE